MGLIIGQPEWATNLNGGLMCSCYFFFPAEDGIRDRNVTGVQTCALPISSDSRRHQRNHAADRGAQADRARSMTAQTAAVAKSERSEERRVGKESRSQSSSYQSNNAAAGTDSRVAYRHIANIVQRVYAVHA